MNQIDEFHESHWPEVWRILQDILKSGEYYALDIDMSEEQTKSFWVENVTAAYVMIHEGQVVGTYYIKPNQGGNGRHVANAGYAVDREARGKGFASAMCEHSIQTATELGFYAMQFNFVVSSNAKAIHIWQKHGFEIVGTLPDAFCHPKLGYVDAYVMYRRLDKG